MLCMHVSTPSLTVAAVACVRAGCVHQPRDRRREIVREQERYERMRNQAVDFRGLDPPVFGPGYLPEIVRMQG